MNPAQTFNLFEYSNSERFKSTLKEFDSLDSYLDDIWNKRERSLLSFWNDESDNYFTQQKFIQFNRKEDQYSLKSGKYVGIIRYKDTVINLLPKIFYQAEDPSTIDQHTIQCHILWWLSYCHKFKFPKSFNSFNSKRSNFFEVLIYLFASYTRESLNKMIYQAYEEIQNDLPYMKGRLDINSYIHNYSRGNKHVLNCIYDSFEIDNVFNRIIKYVANLLFANTEEQENKKLLSEIIFMLDDVSDVKATINDCDKVKINPIFKDLFTVLDYCRLFLLNSNVVSYKNRFEVFAFLLPMEYIFEDFIYGFIRKELTGINITPQTRGVALTTKDEFFLRPDLIINVNRRTIIADTKYKIIYTDGADVKKGISQSDLYQMMAYAVRHKANRVLLFYPSTITDKDLQKNSTAHFEIKDEFCGQTIIIDAHKLKIINKENIPSESNLTLEKTFYSTKEILKKDLTSIFSQIV